MFPQFTLPYQQPPQQVMAVGTSSDDPMENRLFFAAFLGMGLALVIVAGLYGWNRFK